MREGGATSTDVRHVSHPVDKPNISKKDVLEIILDRYMETGVTFPARVSGG